MTRIISLSILVTLILSGLALPAQAQASKGFWENMFPFLFETQQEEGPDPAETLRAPFATGPVEPAGRYGEAEHKEKQRLTELSRSRPLTGQEQARLEDLRQREISDIYTERDHDARNAVNLDAQHRQAEEIGQWVATVSADALAFDPNNLPVHQERIRTYFTPGGFRDYQAFLSGRDFESALAESDLQLHSFIRETPFLVNKGVLAGRYRWLFDVPVTITYMPRGQTNYEKREYPGDDLMIRVQVGRTAESAAQESRPDQARIGDDSSALPDHGILVESWKLAP